mgnify:CR=1 FL=1
MVGITLYNEILHILYVMLKPMFGQALNLESKEYVNIYPGAE